VSQVRALAPEAVFTVRRYGDTSPPYDLGLVRKSTHDEPRYRKSQPPNSAATGDREPSQAKRSTTQPSRRVAETP
jgi:hypothetical protein